MMLLTRFEALIHELLTVEILEEQLTRILDYFQQNLKSLSSGVFLYQAKQFQLKVGRNISHTYTKNTIFHDEDKFIRELRTEGFLSLKDDSSCSFEHECRHIIAGILCFKHETYGFIFADKKDEYFTQEEESLFRMITKIASMLFAVEKLTQFWAGKRELDERTHIYRYKSFLDKGSYLFRLLHRTDFDLSVALMKINRYEELVKTHGRQRADLILQEIFTLIQKNIKPIDILGKIFDNTYALILPNSSPQKAEKMITKIHQELIDNKEIADKHISWGIAGIEKEVNSFEKMVSNAEEAAFDASRNAAQPIMIYEE